MYGINIQEERDDATERVAKEFRSLVRKLKKENKEKPDALKALQEVAEKCDEILEKCGD